MDPRNHEGGLWGRARRAWPLAPALLLLTIFFLVPSLYVAKSSLFDPALTLTHYDRFFDRPVYVDVLLRTLQISAGVAALCTIVGYPVAHYISQRSRKTQFVLLFLIFIPLWMSVLIRSYAWMAMLGREGLVNTLLLSLQLIDSPMKLLFTSGAVYLAMVQILLPVQIVTCYGAMTQIDKDLLRAARILGASRFQAFVRVFLPLSLDGTATAAGIVFILSMGFFITPALLGGQGNLILGNLIEQQVIRLNWGFASALGAMLLLATLGSIAFAKVVRNSLIAVRRRKEA